MDAPDPIHASGPYLPATVAPFARASDLWLVLARLTRPPSLDCPGPAGEPTWALTGLAGPPAALRTAPGGLRPVRARPTPAPARPAGPAPFPLCQALADFRGALDALDDLLLGCVPARSLAGLMAGTARLAARHDSQTLPAEAVSPLHDALHELPAACVPPESLAELRVLLARPDPHRVPAALRAALNGLGGLPLGCEPARALTELLEGIARLLVQPDPAEALTALNVVLGVLEKELPPPSSLPGHTLAAVTAGVTRARHSLERPDLSVIPRQDLPRHLRELYLAIVGMRELVARLGRARLFDRDGKAGR